jgi:hypothetical protein
MDTAQPPPSLLSTRQRGAGHVNPQQPDATTSRGATEQGDTPRYLTDGVRLFRRIEKERIGDVVWLEDCRSLEILVAATYDLRCLRPVFPRDDAIAAESPDSHAANRGDCAAASHAGRSQR